MMKSLIDLGVKPDEPKWRQSALKSAISKYGSGEAGMLECVRFLTEEVGLNIA